MGRNEERERRAGHRLRDAAMSARPPDGARDVAVRNDVPELEARHEPPGLKRQGRARKRKRHVETPQSPPEIRPHLRGRLRQERIRDPRGGPARALERCGNEARVVAFNGERKPEGRREMDAPRARLR